MSDRKAVFLHCPELDGAHYPATCPFKTERAGMTRRILASMNLLSGEHRCEMAPVPATREQMERFHSPGYLDTLEKASAGRLDVEGLYMGLGTSDCPVFADLYWHSTLAVGATLTGAEAILHGEADVAFNPSGGFHHAFPSRAAGFCYINDNALACLRLADAGLKVLYLDVDAHHGDGVQYAAYQRRDILTISYHESGRTLFPGTGFENDIGEGDGVGFAVNVPLPAGTYDAAFLHAFSAIAVPLMYAFAPEVFVLELGLDGLAGDPLTHLAYTNNVYVDVVEHVLRLGKPLLATGGGGYNPGNTARGWALLWAAMSGENVDESMSMGLGGVMLESTDWAGGLRDRVLVVEDRRKEEVDAALAATIDLVRKNVFKYHGL